MIGMPHPIDNFEKDRDKYRKLAQELGAKRGINTETHNDIGDALRHSFVSGMLARKYTGIISNLAGQYHEFTHPNPIRERNMDIWNNKVGIEKSAIAKDASDLFDLLVKAADSGELITDINDPRTEPKPVNKEEFIPDETVLDHMVMEKFLQKLENLNLDEIFNNKPIQQTPKGN